MLVAMRRCRKACGLYSVNIEERSFGLPPFKLLPNASNWSSCVILPPDLPGLSVSLFTRRACHLVPVLGPPIAASPEHSCYHCHSARAGHGLHQSQCSESEPGIPFWGLQHHSAYEILRPQ